MPPKLESHWDVIVLGAGAAGMMAAEQAARHGRRTLLVERNRKPGVKILISGGTRCNLTQNTSPQDLLAAFPKYQARFLRHAVYQFTPSDTRQYFEACGVPTKTEPSGKVFPVSDRAYDVQQALWRRVCDAGVVSCLGTSVLGLDKLNDAWSVRSDDQTWTARALIVTTGGRSYPGCGTRGDGYEWMRRLGLSLVAPRPALVPLTTNDLWVRELSGVTMEDVVVRVVPADRLGQVNDPVEELALCRKQAIAERRQPLLFTHFGLSGPAAMDVSGAITSQAHTSDVRLVCDFVPDQTWDMLSADLRRAATKEGRQSVRRLLSQWVPDRLGQQMLAEAQITSETRLAELSKAQQRSVLRRLKSNVIMINGHRGYEKAEVTGGGVSLQEIDSRSMQSKQHPGLFVAGELLDIDGPIGGYNFQAAFATGRIAGTHAATLLP